jgi:hypothetical protein
VEGSCKHGNEQSGSRNCEEFSHQLRNLFIDSQKQFCSINLVS